MKKITDYLSLLGLNRFWKISIFICLALLVAGFVCPPLGVIDNSVLIGVGLLGLIVDIPLILAFASVNKIALSVDLDDKQIHLTTSEKNGENTPE